MTPRRPLIRGRQARREAPAEPAPRGRPEDRSRQSRQDRSRSGSPGISLGRPCGPGFALRPRLIGGKDHGRRRAQAARQGIPQSTEGKRSYRPHFCASGTSTNRRAPLLRCRREATLGLALASLGPADGGQPGLRAVAVDKPPLGALCQQPPCRLSGSYAGDDQ